MLYAKTLDIARDHTKKDLKSTPFSAKIQEIVQFTCCTVLHVIFFFFTFSFCDLHVQAVDSGSKRAPKIPFFTVLFFLRCFLMPEKIKRI